MSKLTKSEAHPFTGHQPKLSSTDRRTVPSQQDVIDFYKTHERVSWSLTEFLETPWSAIDIDLLTPADVAVVETTMLVEANNPDYVSNLLDYFKSDQDVCDFLMMWGIEEWKHYYALRDYLTKVKVATEAKTSSTNGNADPRLAEIEASVRLALGDDVTAVREASEENWGIPHHYTPAQLCAATTFQEFVTADFYRHHARQVREPVLAKLEMNLAKDETRHEMFYEQRATDCLAAEPNAMPLVMDALKEFGMPGAYLVDDYGERRAAMEAAAFPTIGDRKQAFVRLFNKMARVIGHDNAMTVFTEGNYLSDGVQDPTKKKMRPEMITRLLTRRLG